MCDKYINTYIVSGEADAWHMLDTIVGVHRCSPKKKILKCVRACGMYARVSVSHMRFYYAYIHSLMHSYTPVSPIYLKK